MAVAVTGETLLEFGLADCFGHELHWYAPMRSTGSPCRQLHTKSNQSGPLYGVRQECEGM